MARCSTNGSRERRMLVLKPNTRKVGDEDNKTTVIMYTPEKYHAEDLVFDFLTPKEETEEEEIPFEDSVTVDNNDDWFNLL